MSENNSGGKSYDYDDYRGVIVIKKRRFQNVFRRTHENEKPAFSNSSRLKGVSEKLRFCDGLVWTVGQTVSVSVLKSQIPAVG